MTDWGPYGLDEIWSVVEGETGQVSRRQATAWDKMYELCTWHAKQLRDAAANLSHLWPPEHSLASQKYLDTVAALAQTMTNAADAAIRNSLAISILTDASDGARAAVAALRTTWDQTQKAEAERVRITRSLARGASLVPIGPIAPVAGLLSAADDQTVLTWSNRQPIKAVVDTAGGPDVATDWRATLNQRARDVMVKNDVAAADAKTYLTLPDNAQVPGTSEETWTPPPTSGTRGGSSPFSPLPPPSPPNPATIPSGFSTADARQSDPILDGGALPIPSNAPLPTSPLGQPLPASPEMSPLPNVSMPNTLPPGGLLPRVSTGTGRARPELSRPGVATERLVGPMAPVGRAPGAGPGSMMMAPGGTGRSPAATRGGVRVAPPGGLISSAANSRRRRGDVDPNDPWDVAEGGPAVLTPDPEPADHSPGPGVLGIDR